MAAVLAGMSDGVRKQREGVHPTPQQRHRELTRALGGGKARP